MIRSLLTSTLLLAIQFLPAPVTAQSEKPSTKKTTSNWPAWRGELGNGKVSGVPAPPTQWNAVKNVIWKTPIPGKGHGSVSVFGDYAFVTSADLISDRQSVHCLNKKSGKPVWITTVHQGGLKTAGNKKQNKKASLASTTIATDGKQIFVNFLNQEAAWTTALSMEGKIQWQKKICDYIVHQGYGSSPTLFGETVIVSADNKGGGAIVAFQKRDGTEVWRRDRPAKPNYPSPVVVNVFNKTQLVVTGCDLITSLDPTTGKVHWEIPGATTECVSSTVTDGKHVYTSGGYPKNHISAVVADGSGKIAWEINVREYVPSMIVHQGHLYAILDAGIAACFDSETGETKWKARLGGTFSGSPVLVNGLIYAFNEAGEGYVIKAQPTAFEEIAKNKLGDAVFASPAIADGKIFMRIAHNEGSQRQEYVYCLGEK